MNRERETLRAMIGMYCRGHRHGPGAALCAQCRELLDYAEGRLARCPYQARKPTCANCATHCYAPAMRARIAPVMRYSGPRLIYRRPILALLHLLDGLRKPKRPRPRQT